jgi:hypothetical protein
MRSNRDSAPFVPPLQISRAKANNRLYKLAASIMLDPRMLDPRNDTPQGLKPPILFASGGTAKAVPFQNPFFMQPVLAPYG